MKKSRTGSTQDSEEITRVPKSVLHKAIAASAMGNAVEWFDYGVYAIASTYIAHNFFPGDADKATLAVMATFAVSFLVRPLGGMVLGPLGDKVGRKVVLAMTIILMAGSTFCIGILPTHAVIGFWAPTVLILLRMIQGFSAGGEYGGAATFMAEYAPSKKRGFYGSFLETGTMGGFALGSLVVLVMNLAVGSDAMYEWGWRIPFLIAGPLGLIGMYLRSKLEDTPLYKEQEAAAAAAQSESKRSVWRELFTHYRKQMLIMAGLVIAVNVVNYTLLTYSPTYFEKSVGLDPTLVQVVMFIGQFALMCCIPVFGWISDHVQRKNMWLFSLISLIVLSIPLYLLMRVGLVGTIIGFFLVGLLYLPQLATISATFPAFFPTHVRYAGFAITYNVATALFGGTAPYINDAIIDGTGFTLTPAVSVMVACAIGLVAALYMKDTTGVSIKTDAIAVVPDGQRIAAPGEEAEAAKS
ncbi:MFS transporter [Galactobacter sp.]|uniref:MFS transporter n=1 Tax=Galactobacter sp. TaxID=2676125 RepID=UPI0025BE2F12|nr:MFS transporter [Galactobacter sp.]